MGNAMMEQLLKAGLVDKKQANRAKQKKRDQTKQGEQQAETKARAAEIEQQRQAKLARDRELNQQRQREQAEKAQRAQLAQWVSDHQVSRRGAEFSYHFTHGERIPSILVTEEQREALGRGRLQIVQWENEYHLLPAAMAEKIAGIAPECVVQQPSRQLSEEEAQAYEDFPIPDDLIW